MKSRLICSILILVVLGPGIGIGADLPINAGGPASGPDLASSQLYADLAAATRQNEQLKAALAEAQMRLTLREGDLADLSRQLAQQTALAGSPTAGEAALQAELTQLRGELDQTKAAASAAQKAQADLQSEQEQTAIKLAASLTQLAALRAAGPAKGPGDPSAELTSLQLNFNQARAAAATAQLAQVDLERQLGRTNAQLADVQAQLAAAKATPAAVTPVPTPETATKDQAAEIARLKQELEQARAAATTAQTAKAGLQSQLDQSSQQLAAARTNADDAKATAADRDALKARLADQQAQIEKLHADLAASEAKAAGATDPATLKQELADNTDKLNQTLHAFAVQQVELEHTKAAVAEAEQARAATADQLAADHQIVADRTTALEASQLELTAQRATAARIADELSAVREQLRLAQTAAEAATAENQDLKTRLALAGGPPGPSPISPSELVFIPPALSVPNPSAPPLPPETTPAVAAEPRTHVVVAGDTLSGLARKYYGNAARWNTILDANRALLKNSAMLPIGARLQIP